MKHHEEKHRTISEYVRSIPIHDSAEFGAIVRNLDEVLDLPEAPVHDCEDLLFVLRERVINERHLQIQNLIDSSTRNCRETTEDIVQDENHYLHSHISMLVKAQNDLKALSS